MTELKTTLRNRYPILTDDPYSSRVSDLLCMSNLAHASKPKELDLSRFSAAPSARLSHLAFESDGAFPAQCRVAATWIVEAVDVFEDKRRATCSGNGCWMSLTTDPVEVRIVTEK
jgi:hypothetical protein